MIDAPQAVQIAAASLGKVVPTFAALAPHVEEIKRSSEGNAWIIRFRVDNPEPRTKGTALARFSFPTLKKW